MSKIITRMTVQKDENNNYLLIENDTNEDVTSLYKKYLTDYMIRKAFKTGNMIQVPLNIETNPHSSLLCLVPKRDY